MYNKYLEDAVLYTDNVVNKFMYISLKLFGYSINTISTDIQ